tara:strand:- start:119 stop:436 length:318 start_codon:yes stop_codon:yes gene_type:complete
VFNIGGGEVLVILVVALIFLGPSKLPEIARTLGNVTQTVRRISSSFQSEISSSLDESVETDARLRGQSLVGDESKVTEVAESAEKSESPTAVMSEIESDKIEDDT